MTRKPRAVGAENKLVARHVLEAVGGTPQVNEYVHDTEDLTIDILRCADRPTQGVTTYSTIRLSDSPMLKGEEEFPVRLEMVGACASKNEFFPNVLAAAAFCIMWTRRLVYPGAVLENYVKEYYPSTPVPHLYLTAPFLWEGTLKTLDCVTKKVSWLLAIPISESEKQYLHTHGDSELEGVFEQEQIDIFDLKRVSTV
jgi:hypothetical protein